MKGSRSEVKHKRCSFSTASEENKDKHQTFGLEGCADKRYDIRLYIDLFYPAEAWGGQEGFAGLDEWTAASHLKVHVPRDAGQAVVSQPDEYIEELQLVWSLTVISSPAWRNIEPLLFAIVPPSRVWSSIWSFPEGKFTNTATFTPFLCY